MSLKGAILHSALCGTMGWLPDQLTLPLPGSEPIETLLTPPWLLPLHTHSQPHPCPKLTSLTLRGAIATVLVIGPGLYGHPQRGPDPGFKTRPEPGLLDHGSRDMDRKEEQNPFFLIFSLLWGL